MSKRRVLLNCIVLAAMVSNVSPMTVVASPPISPPQDPGQVYAFYDDFQNGDATGWSPKGTWNVVDDSFPTLYYVAANGSDVSNNCASNSTPCATLQHAVDVAETGGEIQVAAGIYTGVSARAGITQVVYLSNTLTLRGGYTTTNWTTPYPITQPTTLDAQGQGRVLYITGNISPTVEGLYITGGNASGLGGSEDWASSAGSGIYVIGGRITLNRNVIFSNTSSGPDFVAGAGLYLQSSIAELYKNEILSNTAGNGGGIVVYSSTAMLTENWIHNNTWCGAIIASSVATLTNNVIDNNAAGYGGGGALVRESKAKLIGNTISQNTALSNSGGVAVVHSEASLERNLVTHNSANEGGGIGIFDSNVTLANNTIAENEGTAGSGLYFQGSQTQLLQNTLVHNIGGSGIDAEQTISNVASFTNTIIVSHTVGLVVGSRHTTVLNGILWFGNGANTGGAGTIAVTHEITGDPAFAPDGYHLTQASAAIDQGVDAGVTSDIDGDPRPRGLAPDLGADEFSVPWWNTGWGYHARLTVTNNSSTETLPVRYSASITLDTAARIGAGQMTNTCSDVRIISFSGVANTELDRVVEDCNTDHTRVWFALQRPIGPSGLDDSYYLYYGNPSAGAPPANGMNVFLFFEDWEQTTTHWTNAGGLDSVNMGTMGTSVISADEWVSSGHSQQFPLKASGGDAFSGYIPATPGTGYAIGAWAKSATDTYAPVGLDSYDSAYTKGTEVWLWTNEWTIPQQWAYRSGRFTTNASTVYLKIKSEWWNQPLGTEPVYLDNLSLRYALATEPTVASGDEETILAWPVIVTVHDTGPVQIGTAVNVTAVVSATEGTIDAVTLRLQSPVSTDVAMSLTSGDAYTGTWQGSYTPTQGGVYTYRVLAHSTAGRSKLSAAQTFAATDTQPPQITPVSLTDPIPVRNTQTLTVTATDNGAVSSVGVELGGVIHPMTQHGSQYGYSWRVLTVGTITYTVIATDTVGNQATLDGSFQSQAREADVCTWLGCKSGAASWSNDDGNSSCRAELEAAGIRGTYYYNGTGTQTWFADYSAAGHEIGSHSVGHPCDTPACTPNCTPAALWQIPFTQGEVNAYRQDQVEPNLAAIEAGTGKPVVSMAWPCGCADARRMTAASSYFLGVRGYYDYIAQLAWVQDVNEPTPVEFMNLNAANSYDQTFIDRAYNEGKWAIITAHDTCTGIDYMGSRRNALWVAPVGDVLKYIRVRDASQFSNYSRAGRTISFDVQHNLGTFQRQRVDSSYLSPIVFDNPVTLKAHVLDADNVLSVQMNGAPVSFSVQSLEGTRYVVFDSALDSARHVVIALAGPAPTLGTITDNSPVEFGGAAYVTATVTISEGTAQTVTLRVHSPQIADYAMGLVAGTTDTYAASFAPGQVMTTTYQVLASNGEGTTSQSAVRLLVVRDTTPPTWQSQEQAHEFILATEVNTLTAQGLDLGGLKWAILSTNESGAWQEFNWPTSDWWDHAWAHRRAITLTEATGLARMNETVDLFVSATDFPGLTNCAAELRVADVNRVEIPSQVDDVRTDGGSLTCHLLFQASVNANSNRVYYVYYGNPLATLPAYSTDLTSSSAAGVVTVHNSFFDLDLDAASGVVSRVRLPGGSNTSLPLSSEANDYWGWHQVCSSLDGNITGNNSLCQGGAASATGLVLTTTLDGPIAKEFTFTSAKGAATYTVTFRFLANAPYYQYNLARAGTTATVMNNFWYANGNFSRLGAGSGGVPVTAYNIYDNGADQVRVASFAAADVGSIDGANNDGTDLGATDYRNPTASGLTLYVATGADQPAAQDVLARISAPMAATPGNVEAATQGQCGSPMDLHGATNGPLTSFTWQNGTLPDGTSVGWRVKYCDLADNCGATGVMTFTVYIAAADLTLEKLDSPDPVTVGRPITFQITVTNHGPSTASGVTLTDTLPSGMAFGTATPPSGQGTCSGTSQVICNLGDLANGANAVVTLLVTPTVTGLHTNTVSVNAITLDPNPTNNTAEASTSVSPLQVALYAGWNLLTLPMDNGSSFYASAALNEIISQGGNATEVDRWLNGGWNVYYRSLPFTDYVLELGKGYFVRTTSASTWTLTGRVISNPLPITLSFGYNLVGFPKLPRAMTAQDILNGIESQGGACSEMHRWLYGGWSTFYKTLPFTNFSINNTEGYFIRCTQSSTYTPN